MTIFKIFLIQSFIQRFLNIYIRKYTRGCLFYKKMSNLNLSIAGVVTSLVYIK